MPASQQPATSSRVPGEATCALMSPRRGAGRLRAGDLREQADEPASESRAAIPEPPLAAGRRMADFPFVFLPLSASWRISPPPPEAAFAALRSSNRRASCQPASQLVSPSVCLSSFLPACLPGRQAYWLAGWQRDSSLPHTSTLVCVSGGGCHRGCRCCCDRGCGASSRRRAKPKLPPQGWRQPPRNSALVCLHMGRFPTRRRVCGTLLPAPPPPLMQSSFASAVLAALALFMSLARDWPQ